PRGFASSVAKFGYYQQDPFYLDALVALGHDEPGFVFVAQEKEPPYSVGVYELRHADREMGRERNALARQIFGDCTEAGVWPAYRARIQPLHRPRWLSSQRTEDFSWAPRPSPSPRSAPPAARRSGAPPPRRPWWSSHAPSPRSPQPSRSPRPTPATSTAPWPTCATPAGACPWPTAPSTPSRTAARA